MDDGQIVFVILGMAAVTYLPRLLPAWLLSSARLPDRLVEWLSHVPPAVLAALLIPGLLAPDGALDLSPNNLFLLAAAPTGLIALWTRSMLGSIAAGMVLVAAARWWGPW
jgi:branched-subunit amino acid transport protein